MIGAWNWLKTHGIEWAIKILEPWISILVVISGVLITYDFSTMKAKYPNWAGLFSFMEAEAFFWVFILSAVVSALLSWAMKVLQKSLNELKAEITETRDQIGEVGNNIKFLFDGLLLNLSKKLDFKQGDQARISIYVYEAESSQFIPCGRYSPNPELRKPGRTAYPDRQGCIAKGWQNGWHYDDEFPDTKTRHQNHCSAQYGIPKEVHNGLKMMSLVYAVKRLDDAAGNPLAVMVIESTKKDQFDPNQLQADLETVADDFSQMIATLRQHIPSPSDASERGL